MRIRSKAVFLATVTMLAAPVFGGTGGFTSTISAEQQGSIGVTNLTESEREALDAQVAAELALARQGDVKGFAGTFTSRRSAGEREAAGLDRLTGEQREELDRIVASLIAAGPPQPRSSRLLTSEDISRAHKRFETHGSFSYTIGGASGGRSFQGGSVSTMLLDTKTGSSIEFTYSQYQGDLLGLYGAGYYCEPTLGGFHGTRTIPRGIGRGSR